MDKNAIRTIKIKTGVLKRSLKDYNYYREESKKLEARVDKLREDGADEHDIQKQTEVMQESITMLPTCKTKIESALEDLKSVIEEHLENEEFKASEEGKAAETVITEATTFLQDL